MVSCHCLPIAGSNHLPTLVELFCLTHAIAVILVNNWRLGGLLLTIWMARLFLEINHRLRFAFLFCLFA